MNSMKRQKEMTMKDEISRLVGTQYASGEENDKPILYSCLENPMNSMKMQNEELPRSVGVQYATGDQWRNNSRKSEGMEPKQKQCTVVDMSGDKVMSNAVKSNTE